MGCEAYITISRITSGHHLIDPDDPVFCVREPVAIVGAHPYKFGHGMYSFHAHSPYTEMIGYTSLQGESSIRIQSIPLCIGMKEEQEPVFGIQVWPKDLFEALYPEWRADPPGSVNSMNLNLAWGRITPGYWAVTEYRVEGSEGYFGWCKRGIETEDPPVEWEIWT